jgi:hypothetical protein
MTEGDDGAVFFQRVNDAPSVTTSNNPTDPTIVKHTQQTHQRQTHANTPGQLPAIVNPDNDAPRTRRSPRLATSDDEPIITITTPSSSRIPLHSPNIIAVHAINHLTHQVYSDPSPIWLSNSFISSSPADPQSTFDIDIEHFCNGVQHPVTGETITKYQKLINIPQMREVWTTAFGKEFGNLAQGDNKQERKVRTQFLLCRMMTLPGFLNAERLHIVALSLIIDHKKLTQIVSVSLWVATS